jgi:hypothetical protein
MGRTFFESFGPSQKVQQKAELVKGRFLAPSGYKNNKRSPSRVTLI